MTENEKKLLDIVEDFFEWTDTDGICENGCSCGECENCIEHQEKFIEYKKIKSDLTKKE